MEKIIAWSIKNRFLVVVFTFLTAGLGIVLLNRLPIDAVPDVTNVQVQIITDAPSLGPIEVEQFVTFPVESAMSGLPDIQEIRSVSKFGLSVVTVIFKDHVDLYFARRLVMERLSVAREEIPPEFGAPEMGPISTGLGEIYQFEVKGEGYSAMELRTILDWYVAYQLRSVPGVVEVNTFGGELKTYEVALDPTRLIAYQIPITEMLEVLEKNNANAGGGYIAKQSEQYLIRGEGLVKDLKDIENIVVSTTAEGTPIFIRNLGEVRLAPMIRQGAVTRDGQGEAVTGIVMMLWGENSRVVVDRVKQKIEEIKKTLPKGVTIDTFYDRTDLVRRTIRTVVTNLIEAAILVAIVLFVFLGNVRGGLLVASVIPLALLFATLAMTGRGVSASLMSLGALDLGMVVDGAVVMVEAILLRLAANPGHPLVRENIFHGAVETVRPIFFAILIIILVYLPIASFTGVEGRMFRPMVFTVVAALGGGLLFTLTYVPAVSSVIFRVGVQEKETRIMRVLHAWYHKSLSKTLQFRKRTFLIALIPIFLMIILAPFLGAEFIPKLEEGAVALQAWRIPSVSLEESILQTTRLEKILKTFPEVVTVVSKTGRPEIATDPMGVEISDIFIILKPHKEWKTAHSKEKLIEKMDAALKSQIPGSLFSYSQPIELRVSELIAGVRSDVAVKIFGEDLPALKDLGDQIVRVLSRVRGAADVKAEQIAGLPVLRAIIDREKIARFGLNVSDVLETIRVIGGREVGEILEGQKRFVFQVRLAESFRADPYAIENLPILAPGGKMLPLGEVAQIAIEDGPAQISRENIQRRLTVEANVRGRDLAGFVAEAQEAIAKQIELPPGYYLDWGGQFENLERASDRLLLLVPVALFTIFLLIFMTFGEIRPVLLIFSAIPFAASGGVLALFLRGLPFSISAGVGFVALFGISVLTGIVLVSHIRSKRQEGIPLDEAVASASSEKFRSILVASLVPAIAFIPMAISRGAGAEVQHPLASVVIGGLVTAFFFTCFVLPLIYGWFETKKSDIEL
jgi:cobalt-zinc-cadmium resistance protein CzcA